MLVWSASSGKNLLVGSLSAAFKAPSFKLIKSKNSSADLHPLISVSLAGRKGETESCILSVSSDLIEFKVCIAVVYVDNILHILFCRFFGLQFREVIYVYLVEKIGEKKC